MSTSQALKPSSSISKQESLATQAGDVELETLPICSARSIKLTTLLISA